MKSDIKIVLEKIKEWNEPEVALYIWINDKGETKSNGIKLHGKSAGIGGACDVEEKAVLVRGPGRGLINTAEVIYYKIFPNTILLYEFQSTISINISIFL